MIKNQHNIIKVNLLFLNLLTIVAHQWKQPLNSISLNILKIEIKEDYTEESIKQCSKNINNQLNHLSETLDEFRKFFRNVNELKDIKLDMILKSTEMLLEDDLTHNNITLKINYNDNIVINVIPNEFKHIFINLISNSKEAFIEKDIQNRTIEINSFIENDKTIIIYRDNAGGIPKNIIDRIFNLNYSTKETGTGIGLYMCKNIIEKHGAIIEVENIEYGI
ncbi:MAG: HAMP domain-containing sensor histidine kinase [Campylobacterota bacterium]|nr:HAMP domain-containing sensor histidine kinase [Campylobacterota bacterium]